MKENTENTENTENIQNIDKIEQQAKEVKETKEVKEVKEQSKVKRIKVDKKEDNKEKKDKKEKGKKEKDWGIYLIFGFLIFLGLLTAVFLFIGQVEQSNKEEVCKDFCFPTCNEFGCSCIGCCYHEKVISGENLLEIVCKTDSEYINSNISWIAGDWTTWDGFNASNIGGSS